MDWIETVFGISPDGGSGLFEVLLAIAVGLGAGLLLFYRLRLRQTSMTGSAEPKGTPPPA
jgi:hypothetical protein